MKAIYEPKGAALEYAPLACNLFRGCNHGCVYCYCPGVLRMDRAEFHREVRVRDGILAAMDRDAALLAGRGDTRRVHLCFTCDPFGTGADHGVTREALAILRRYKRPVAVLTKGVLSDEDIGAMEGMDLHLGVSWVWLSDAARAKWEPKAAPIVDRAMNLIRARKAGLRTFVSMEPVVDADESLSTLGVVMELADEIRVGKLNHADTPKPVPWRWFAEVVNEELTRWAAEKPGRTWMLKRGLAELLDTPATTGGRKGCANT